MPRLFLHHRKQRYTQKSSGKRKKKGMNLRDKQKPGMKKRMVSEVGTQKIPVTS